MASNSEAQALEIDLGSAAGVSELFETQDASEGVELRSPQPVGSNFNAGREPDLEQQPLDMNVPLTLATVGTTFSATLALPGVVKDHGKDQGAAKTAALKVFVFVDIMALLASITVVVFLVFMKTPPAKVVKLVLCIAVGFTALAILAAAYILVPPP
ncbi:hypothetical protein KI387_027664 [Taxus chinensis]|uniref:PGG domain-containing protein n=1 Tax=Taxus chinensis TaxID=29808 RepID=A0AA38G0K0_TAXCH|nr:hypothetical protein KI387_027664 [Taxus chinensis]